MNRQRRKGGARQTTDSHKRFWELDAVRGAAVILMVAYHFAFDLDYFGILDTGIGSPEMQLLARSIGSTFLLVVGISLSLSFARARESNAKEVLLKQFKRGIFLAGIAALITIATFIYPNKGFVVFGIMHLIAFSVIVSLAFKDFYWLNLALGAIMIVAGIAASSTAVDTPFLVWAGLVFPGFYTLDYYPALPWFGVVLMGMFLGKTFYPNAKRAFELPSRLPRREQPRAKAYSERGSEICAENPRNRGFIVGITETPRVAPSNFGSLLARLKTYFELRFEDLCAFAHNRGFSDPRLFIELLEVAGKNSLAIYLLHQPMLVGLIQAFLLIAR